MAQDGQRLLEIDSLVANYLALLERRARGRGVLGLVQRSDETGALGPGTVQGRVWAPPFWTDKEWVQAVDPSRLSLKIGFEVPKHPS
jgi:hypothetical protein